MAYSIAYRKLCANLRGEGFDLDAWLQVSMCINEEMKYVLITENLLYYVFKHQSNEIRTMNPATREISVFHRYEANEPVQGINGHNSRYMIVTNVTKIHIYILGEDGDYHTLHVLGNTRFLNPEVVAISKNQPVMTVPHEGGSGKSIKILSIENQEHIGEVINNAHNENLKLVAINNDATLVATASVAGTIVKLYDQYGIMLNKFRRHQFSSDVYALVFSDCSGYLACASKNKPIFVYKLKQDMPVTLKGRVNKFMAEAAASTRSLLSRSSVPVVSHFASVDSSNPVVHGFIQLDESLGLMISELSGNKHTAHIYKVEPGSQLSPRLNSSIEYLPTARSGK